MSEKAMTKRNCCSISNGVILKIFRYKLEVIFNKRRSFIVQFRVALVFYAANTTCHVQQTL